jgi:hypothetical protein
MKVRILYHDHCFDGAASAAYFNRFVQDKFYPNAQFAFTGMAHKAAQLFEPELFDGDVNAIVDFKYSPDERLTWWFDHHQSAFLTPEDQAHYERTRHERRLYLDIHSRSCTKYIARIAREEYGFEAPDLDELVRWADIIDGAVYDRAEIPVEMKEPALQLVLVIEAAKGSETVQRIIGLMQHRSLRNIMEDPEIQAIYRPLYERHLRSIDLIRQLGHCAGGVISFDVADYDMEGYNKFVPYYLFPDGTYTVSVSLSSFRTKISVGSNPWAPEEPRHNLATICERYGGGGHPRVGAISFERHEVDRARAAAREIIEELRGEPSA